MHAAAVMQAGIYAPVLAMPALSGYRRLMGMNIAERIKRLRLSRGMNQAALAELLEVTQATISRWEKGSTPDSDKLAKLAEISGLSIDQFLSSVGAGVPESGLLNSFWVKGAVAAGVWSLAYEWAEQDWKHYSGGAHIKAPDGKRYGLSVSGESMNDVYPHGTILDCVSIFDLSDLRSGQRVIVERERDDGEIEATVKEYVCGEDGSQWLVPRSHNPAFQQPISLSDPGERVVEVRVVAKVVGSYRPE